MSSSGAAQAAFPAYNPDAATDADQATPKIHFIYADEAVSMVPPFLFLPLSRRVHALCRPCSLIATFCPLLMAVCTGGETSGDSPVSLRRICDTRTGVGS
jgi:hypothetical protein